MPYFIPFTASGFPSWVPIAQRGGIGVTDQELVWAAATLGDRKRSLPWSQTYGASIQMRVNALRAAFKTYCGCCLAASHTYAVGLDDSEKRYLSYLLGGVSARLFASRTLGVPHLVHFDSVLRAAGRPVTGRRPDFVGVGKPPLSARIIVEAKGTLGVSRRHVLTGAAEKAKLAAGSRRRPRRLAWGHEAHFESPHGDPAWSAALVDPPDDDFDFPPAADLLVGYYMPIAVEFRNADTTEIAGSENSAWYVRTLPEQEVQVAIRRDIVEAVVSGQGRLLQELTGLRDGDVDGDEIADAQQTQDLMTSAPPTRPFWEGNLGNVQEFVGHDGVAVRLLGSGPVLMPDVPLNLDK